MTTTQPPPDTLTTREVATLLGVPPRYLIRHRRTLFGWLPVPTLLRGSADGGHQVTTAILWPAEATRAAIAQGRPQFTRGWHTVPAIVPAVHVWVPFSGARPTRVRILALPAGDTWDLSVWLDSIEEALHQTFGHLAYLDTPAPCVPGVWPIGAATLGELPASPRR